MQCDQCRELNPKPDSAYRYRTRYFRRIPRESMPDSGSQSPASSPHSTPSLPVPSSSQGSTSSGSSVSASGINSAHPLCCSLATCHSKKISRHCLSRACRTHCLEAGGCPARGHDLPLALRTQALGTGSGASTSSSASGASLDFAGQSAQSNKGFANIRIPTSLSPVFSDPPSPPGRRISLLLSGSAGRAKARGLAISPPPPPWVPPVRPDPSEADIRARSPCYLDSHRGCPNCDFSESSGEELEQLRQECEELKARLKELRSPSPTLSSPGCPYTVSFPPMPHISQSHSSSSSARSQSPCDRSMPSARTASSSMQRVHGDPQSLQPVHLGRHPTSLPTRACSPVDEVSVPPLHDDTPRPARTATLLQAHSNTATRSGSPLRRLSARARGKRPRAPTPEDVIDLTLDSPPQLKKTRTPIMS